ncbi:MAG: NAD-dependent epimerase/dehydratase family protein [Fimbriimonas sp.]
MKVAVTGGSGRVGMFVLRDLRDNGHSVHNFDLRHPNEWVSPFMKVDATKAAQVYDALAQVRPDAVVHLAANPAPYGNPRHEVFQTNVLAAFNVMQAAADLGIKKIVYASSEMASGWSSTKTAPLWVPFAEEDRTPPPNAYALSKFVGEVIGASIVAAHPEIQLASLRLNWVLLPPDYERIRKNKDNLMAGHTTLWSYIDVRDVASSVRACLQADIPGKRVYMVAAADTMIDIPTREAIARHFGPQVEVAADLPEFGSCVDCSRIQREVGWLPTHSWRDEVRDEVPAEGESV